MNKQVEWMRANIPGFAPINDQAVRAKRETEENRRLFRRDPDYEQWVDERRERGPSPC